MKNLILNLVLVPLFSLFAIGSMNAQEEIKPKIETITEEVSKKECEKACCAKNEEGKKECAKGDVEACCASKDGDKKSCHKDGKKECSKKDKKSCKKKCSKKDKKSCKKEEEKEACKKACCADKK